MTEMLCSHEHDWFGWDFCYLDKMIQGHCYILHPDDYDVAVGVYEWPREIKASPDLIPKYGCVPEDSDDIYQIFQFANKYPDLKVNFKNNGHSYFASSAASLPGDGNHTLLISVRELNDIEVLDEGWLNSKKQWQPQPAVKIGGGVVL